MASKEEEEGAAQVIQKTYRQYFIGNTTASQQAPESQAVAVIWRVWTSYKMRKQYKYFRDLIRDAEYLNPYDTLKVINPNEAKLVDRAAGTILRFRLGGEFFPPNVYYKISTTRPVVDMCAMSPLDYAAQPAVWNLDTHNKPSRKSLPKDESEWYKRFENNGWRLVTESNFKLPSSQDPVTLQTSQQRKPFHYSKVTRKKDLDRKRKERKITWMMKMYKAGKEREEKEKGFVSKEKAQDRVKQTDGILKEGGEAAFENSEEDLGEGEVEKLIAWSQQANFDQYLEDWSHLACASFTDSLQDLGD